MYVGTTSMTLHMHTSGCCNAYMTCLAVDNSGHVLKDESHQVIHFMYRLVIPSLLCKVLQAITGSLEQPYLKALNGLEVHLCRWRVFLPGHQPELDEVLKEAVTWCSHGHVCWTCRESILYMYIYIYTFIHTQTHNIISQDYT